MQIVLQTSEMFPLKSAPEGCEAPFENGGKKPKAPTTPSVTIGKSNRRNSTSKGQETGITVYLCILVLF